MQTTTDLPRRRGLALAAVALTALLTAPAAPQGQEPSPGARPGVFDPSESLLVDPLLLDDEQPDARSVRHIHFLFEGAIGAPPGVDRTREEALELARAVRAELVAGGDFAALARRHSASRNAVRGGVMGTLPRGILVGVMDDFLFGAEIGDLSEPLLTPTGYHILQRVERWAAARTIQVRGKGAEARAKLVAARERIAAGEDFATVAAEVSEDPITAGRGGAMAIFERGPTDRLLKALAFRLEVGEVSEPVESPLGLHLVQRVPEDQLDEALRENNWIRARALVLIQNDTPLEIPTSDRNSTETMVLANELAARIEAGEDFAALAAEYNEDFANGRARAGDLGWIHRRQPSMSPALIPLFGVEPGTLLGPTPTTFGWMLVKRER